WTGVPLSVVLDEAGLRREARWVLAEGADSAGMTRSIPIDKCLDDALLVYAAVMALAVGPLLWFGLPATEATAAVAARRGAGSHGRIFVLLVAAIALNSFVTFGIQAVGVPLLQAMGMDLARAVAVASLLGVFKVGGRVLDLLGGGRWDWLSTGIAAGAMIPLGLVAIWIGGAGLLPVVGYLLLFGVGSGAFAVARATMPLVFFDKAGYAAAMAGRQRPGAAGAM
ncbi:MAG: molybdopterin-dependent oxidoreductase, partial [Achromobacter sp.]|nr:molybdopterin-dependent oxidoreductase [Achromobacter sp.]